MASSNILASLVNGKRTATRVFHHSTRSFRNKPLVALDWFSKSRKRHRYLPKCDQGKRIRGKIFFSKEYYFWDCTHNILISINILFALFSYFCFANFTGLKLTKFVHTIIFFKNKFVNLFFSFYKKKSNWKAFLNKNYGFPNKGK